VTNQRFSPGTSCRKAAQKLIDAENQAHESPALGQELAKAYLCKRRSKTGTKKGRDKTGMRMENDACI